MPNITPLFTIANQILINFFDKDSGRNYIAHEIEDNKTGDSYIITMQKVDGETPLHQLQQLKEDYASLEEEHRILKEKYSREQHGNK